MLLAVASSGAARRIGVPALIAFVGVGLLAGSEGPGGIRFDDGEMSAVVGSIALAVILFNGGMDTPLRDFRAALVPALVLSTAGVAVTAVVVGLTAAWLTPLSPLEGLLLGAIVSSTDAAAVFGVLRGRGLPTRLRQVLEAESGTNDPMAVFLTVALTAVVTSGRFSAGDLALGFAWQMTCGAIAGVLVGRVAAAAINRLRLEAVGLYPVFALAAGVLAFSITNLLGGNGFLGVYLAGLVLGNVRLAHQQGISRFLDGMGWLAQILMFVLLGLLAFPSRLIAQAPTGLLVAAVLVLVARPAAVWGTLTPLGRLFPAYRLGRAERHLLSWAGLRGAVPIVLSITPLIAGAENGPLIFDTVFFAVVVSTLAQGWSVGPLAARLGLTRPEPPAPPVVIEITGVTPVDGEVLDFAVTPGSWLTGRTLSELELPDDVVIAAVYRAGRLVAARGTTRLAAGDHVYVIAERVDHARTLEILQPAAPA